MLERLKENALTNSGRYDDEFIIDFFHSKLSTKECQNKGFVLDGYPLSFNIAQKLFGSERKDLDSSNEDSDIVNIPSYFIVLEAKEQRLRQRIINLNQEEVEGENILFVFTDILFLPFRLNVVIENKKYHPTSATDVNHH